MTTPDHATTLRSGLSEPKREDDHGRQAGETVGRFIILGVLGEGGMGVVYRAYDPELDRRVAIKVLRGAAQERRSAVLREARALARLSHPNVVAVYDVGEHDGEVFAAMELVDGLDLAAWLKQAKRTQREIYRVLRQAGVALAAAHEAGIIHRDFKPQNVLVGRDGTAAVADFGLALARPRPTDAAGLLREQSERDRKTELPPGTPAYLAPELYDQRSAGPRSDLYSFCVTAWEALCGKSAFAVHSETALLAEKRKGPPTGRVRATPRLQSLLRRGLDPDPARRPESLAPILSALQAAERGPARFWGVAILVGIGVGLSSAALIVEGTDRCGGATERTDTVWNQNRREAIQAAFEATGAGFAEATWNTVARETDGYIADWQAAYRDACEATHVRHEQSSAMLDRRMVCLDRRLTQLDAFLAVLAEVDRDVAVQAAVAITKIGGSQVCAREELEAEPVSDPVGSEALDRAEVLEAVARYDEALEIAKAVEADADEAPLRLEASYRVGRLLDRTSDHKAALTKLEETHWGSEAAGLDDLATKAGIYIVYELAAVAGKPDDALAWAPHVRASLLRSGDNELDRAALVENIGVAHLYKPAPDVALEFFEESLKIREAVPGDNDLAIVSSLNNLGIVYEELRRYDDAIATHQRALSIIKGRVGDEHPHTARSYDNLGTAYLRNSDVSTALEHFERALQIRRSALGSEHRTVALSAVHLALAALQAGEPQRAVDHYEEALAIYKPLFEGDVRETLICHEGLAHAYAELEKWQESQRHARRALDGLGETLGEEHAEIKALRGVLARADEAAGTVGRGPG